MSSEDRKASRFSADAIKSSKDEAEKAKSHQLNELKMSEEYRTFESKTLDEQADEITSDLIWNKKNFLFEFDGQDQAQRDELVKEFVGAGITFSLVTAIDLRFLNANKFARMMGPLKKFLIINTLQFPLYIWYYYRLNNNYMGVKKHMVKKYLLLGDEVLFKKMD